MSAPNPVPDVLVTARNALQERFLDEYRLLRHLGGWRAVAEQYDISKGLAWKIGMRGHVPKDNAIRARIGIAQRAIVEVEITPEGPTITTVEE